jgi:amino acid adenylation domain-containing protein
MDLRGVQPDADSLALAQAESLAGRPFDLAHDPVLRVGLFQTGAEKYLLVIVLHHIAGDQWSLGLIARELALIYNARARGIVADLAPLSITYRDYARWQRGEAFLSAYDRQATYWRKQLAHLPPLDLPTDRPRPELAGLTGATLTTPLPLPLIDALERLGQRTGSTLFMTMVAGYAVLLHRLTGQDDIPIGVPVANRPQTATEALVGTFVNTLVLRIPFPGNPSFIDFLGHVRGIVLEAFAHPDVPFDKLVQELRPRGGAARAPLVQTLFNVTNAPMHGIDFDGLNLQPVIIDRGGSQFELSITVDTQITHSISVEYSTDLFDRMTVERMVERLLTIFQTITSVPDTPVRDIIRLPSTERALLQAWNRTEAAFPSETIFSRTFEDQVARSGSAVAVSFMGATLSYAELNAKSNAIARRLRELGVAPGVYVGLCAQRSLDLVVALLAIQKSGGAYVPLDPEFPAERLDYMLATCGAKVIVTAGGMSDRLKLADDMTCLDLTAEAEILARIPTSNLQGGAGPDDPAYAIYTSGSTGQPKAVVVPHRALTNFLWSMRQRPGLTDADTLAAVTTISFDIAALELYLPLMVGARIELVPSDIASNGLALSRLLAASAASVMQATPATWQLLLAVGWTGCAGFRALSGGEALSRDLADALLDAADEVWNLYGPTETTIWSTVAQVERGAAHISIGKPIANTQVYVLDSAGEQVAPGIAGEIHIGGAGVATGYLGQPDLTAERFLPDPFSATRGARMYKTGDLGRWGVGGNLYHLGRLDNQVKIRGFRIELEEIETVLRSHPSVYQAVVVAREAQPGDQRLVAYLVHETGETITSSDARRYLRRKLPEYMIPSMVMAIDSLPLTPNGKLDRNALPDPFNNVRRTANHTDPPTSQSEQMMAAIWQSVLGIDKVSLDDNFFELGGHSLLSLRVAQAVEKQTGHRMDPRALYFHSLRQIAAMLGREMQPLT